MPPINLTDLLEAEDKITIETIVNAMRLSAEDMHLRVKATEVINVITPVMFSGYNSGLDEIEVVTADNTVGVAIGITSTALALGESGNIVTGGVLDEVDTSAFTEGDILYVNGGTLSIIEPTVGYSQPIGYVLKSNAVIGSIMVDISYPKQDASDVRFDATKTVADELALKAPLASPALTGIPTTPTASVDDNSTIIASTLYVINQINAEAGSTLATLVGGLVPSAQLPAYVDDVLEFADFASLPATGGDGKIYVTLDDNLTYRWSGTVYIEISASLALGETSSTAYYGDLGKIAYDHSQVPHGDADADNTTNNETSHVDVVVDGDFASEGVMYRGATTGVYSMKVIGTDIQAYDVDTVKYDAQGTFTSAQRGEISTSTNSINFINSNNFSFTATADPITAITGTNLVVGQSGTLLITSSDLITGWSEEFDWGYQGVPVDLLGIETFGYFISASTGVDSIKIGRV